MSINKNKAISFKKNIKKKPSTSTETVKLNSRKSTDTEKQKFSLPFLNPVWSTNWVNVPNLRMIFKITVLKPIKTPAQSAQFISLSLFSMYLYCTAELPGKYTLSAPLPSLQNKPEKMLYSDPSHPRSHSAGIRQKNKAFAWGPHCRPVLWQPSKL